MAVPYSFSWSRFTFLGLKFSALMHALSDSPSYSFELFYYLPSEHIEENFIYLAKKYWDQVQNFVPDHLTGGSLIEGWMIAWLAF